MSLISCPHCGSKISDSCEKCIHCGKALVVPEMHEKSSEQERILSFYELPEQEREDLKSEFFSLNTNLKKQNDRIKLFRGFKVFSFFGPALIIAFLVYLLINTLYAIQIFKNALIITSLILSVAILIASVVLDILSTVYSINKKAAIDNQFREWLMYSKRIKY